MDVYFTFSCEYSIIVFGTVIMDEQRELRIRITEPENLRGVVCPFADAEIKMDSRTKEEEGPRA